jgi:SAM-dependent methyltransferase
MLTREHLDALRRCEIGRVLSLVPSPRGRLLEIGAAGGFQAALLAAHFDRVDAVDLPRSIPGDALAHPVQPYDGRRLPFPDRSFDVVFSSNVLEHIAHVEAFQAEIRRVLKPGGRAVHVLPSASWRLWTILTHYLDLPARVVARFRPAASPPPQPSPIKGEGAKDVCPIFSPLPPCGGGLGWGAIVSVRFEANGIGSKFDSMSVRLGKVSLPFVRPAACHPS